MEDIRLKFANWWNRLKTWDAIVRGHESASHTERRGTVQRRFSSDALSESIWTPAGAPGPVANLGIMVMIGTVVTGSIMTVTGGETEPNFSRLASYEAAVSARDILYSGIGRDSFFESGIALLGIQISIILIVAFSNSLALKESESGRRNYYRIDQVRRVTSAITAIWASSVIGAEVYTFILAVVTQSEYEFSLAVAIVAPSLVLVYVAFNAIEPDSASREEVEQSRRVATSRELQAWYRRFLEKWGPGAPFRKFFRKKSVNRTIRIGYILLWALWAAITAFSSEPSISVAFIPSVIFTVVSLQVFRRYFSIIGTPRRIPGNSRITSGIVSFYMRFAVASLGGVLILQLAAATRNIGLFTTLITIACAAYILSFIDSYANKRLNLREIHQMVSEGRRKIQERSGG